MTVFSRIRDVVGWVSVTFAVLAAMGVLALSALAVVNVVLRNMGGGLENMVGLGEVGVAAVALLGATQAQRRGAHIRTTFLLERISQQARAWCEVSWRVLVTAFVLWMAQAATERAMYSVDISESRFGVVDIWPARIAIAASLILLALQLAIETFERMLIALHRIAPEDIATPEPVDPTELFL